MESLNNTKAITGKVHAHETFGLVDGPGVRYVVFLQGCHMRCQYCHNPETWSMEGGEIWTPEDLFKKVYRYKQYWGDNGGITVSGGEPLLQIDFVTEFFRLAKEKKVHTVLDTSGNSFSMEESFLSKFDKLMEYTDLVMLDLKEMNSDKHKTLTKWGNENILQMARHMSELGKDMWIRRVLVPGLTDDEEGLKALSEFIESLNTVKRVEVLPYHTLGLFKWDKLGEKYPLEGVPTPTEEEVAKAEEILQVEKYK